MAKVGDTKKPTAAPKRKREEVKITEQLPIERKAKVTQDIRDELLQVARNIKLADEEVMAFESHLAEGYRKSPHYAEELLKEAVKEAGSPAEFIGVFLSKYAPDLKTSSPPPVPKTPSPAKTVPATPAPGEGKSKSAKKRHKAAAEKAESPVASMGPAGTLLFSPLKTRKQRESEAKAAASVVETLSELPFQAKGPQQLTLVDPQRLPGDPEPTFRPTTPRGHLSQRERMEL